MLSFILSVNCFAHSMKSPFLVYGPKTPPGLKSNYNSTFSLFLSSNFDSIDLSSLDFPSFILDISLDPSLFPILDSISSYFKVPYLTITKTSDLQYSSNRFFVFPPTSQEAWSLMAMIKYFEWEKFSVLSSNFKENLHILKILSDYFNDFQMKKYIYDENINEDVMDALIKRYIKAAGVKNLVVLDQGNSLEVCIRLLKLRKLEQFGSYFLFGLGNFKTGVEGAIELAYEIGKDANSIEQFYTEVINYLISQLKTFTFEDFKEICSENVCLKEFSVVNVKNGYKEIVGTVKNSIKITKPLLFSGNNTDLKTENVKKRLPIMIANGTAEPNGMINAKTSYSFNGAIYAAELANLDKDFQDFEFVFIPTDCGNILYDLKWCMSCLSKYTKNLGLAYITGFWSESSLANSLSLKAMKVFLPQISTSSGSGFMNNKTLFPEFLKMTGDGNELLQNSLIMFKFFNWKDVIFLTGDGTLDRLRYEIFAKNFKDMGIKIINPEEYRYFPDNYTRDDFFSFKGFFEYIKNTKCRLIFLMVTSRMPILEAFYDVGLRKGDLIIISYIKSLYAFDDKIDEKFTEKHLEMLYGSLAISTLEYNSNYGKIIEKELQKKFSPIMNMCNTFDTFLTISNSLKYLIKKGEDYEDPHYIIQGMRSQRFSGCTGNVYFAENENSKVTQFTTYYQFFINSTTNKNEYVQFISLSKFSVLAARLINEPVWATDDGSTPTNYRIASICVYSKHKQRSKYGLIMLHIISIMLFLLTAIVAFFSQKFFSDAHPKLVNKTLPSYQDVMYQLFFICEFFQIMALDIKSGVISKISRNYNYFAGLDMATFYKFENNQFWIFHLWLMILTFLYSSTVIFTMFIMKKFKNSIKYFELVTENALPLIGHISFMPLILMFMNIYQCEEGLSNEITDSFLSKDCSEFCYKGKHLYYVSISSISLLIFLIISTFIRPFWQTIQIGLRLRTSSKYLSILSISQLFLVLLKVNLEPYSKVMSGYLICGVILCLVFITFRMKPFNYGKIIRYQIILLLMSFWAIFVSTTFEMVSEEKFEMLTLIGGLCIICVVGLKITDNSQEIFISDEPNLIPDLIKFQFSPDRNRVRPESKYRAAEFKDNSDNSGNSENSLIGDQSKYSSFMN